MTLMTLWKLIRKPNRWEWSLNCLYSQSWRCVAANREETREEFRKLKDPVYLGTHKTDDERQEEYYLTKEERCLTTQSMY